MDVVTMGETMAIFSPETTIMRYASLYSRKFGGAETNVAIGLTRLGHKVGWISRVGNDELGKSLLSFVRGEGIDVSCVTVDQTAPTGLQFKEIRSKSQVNVQYYRSGSAASKMSEIDIDENYIKSSKYLHITGITPALSESCYRMVRKAIDVAKNNGVKVVFDPNLRRKLWSEDQARKVLVEIAKNSDIVLPGIAEGAFMFSETNPEKIATTLLENGVKVVVLKAGEEGAYYYTETKSGFVNSYKVEEVVDPVGAGDGFACGFLSGLLDQKCVEEAVQRGNAVGAMAVRVKGDFEGLPDRHELQAFISTENSEDVDR